jgi:hypothetical protein
MEADRSPQASRPGPGQLARASGAPGREPLACRRREKGRSGAFARAEKGGWGEGALLMEKWQWKGGAEGSLAGGCESEETRE